MKCKAPHCFQDATGRIRDRGFCPDHAAIMAGYLEEATIFAEVLPDELERHEAWLTERLAMYAQQGYPRASASTDEYATMALMAAVRLLIQHARRVDSLLAMSLGEDEMNQRLTGEKREG